MFALLDQHPDVPLAGAPSHLSEFVAAVVGDALDPSGNQVAQHHVVEAQRTDGGRMLLLDLGSVVVPDTAGVRRLCIALRRLVRSGPPIVLTDAAPHVRRVLELCAIDGLMLVPSPDLPSPGDRSSRPGAACRESLPAATGRSTPLRAVSA